MQTLGLFQTPQGQTFGGMYVPESLVPALEELEAAFLKFSHDDVFMARFHQLLTHYAGRPTALYRAENLSRLWGADIWLKREDMLHGGAHKTNNAIGQGLLAQAMGKRRIIAETGAGQHGVATAMAGALLNLETVVYMGEVDMARQAPNVYRMSLMGTTVVPVTSGSRTLKDAVNDALRDWITNVRETHYILGTAAGPHPFPAMVKFFHQVIGTEARQQILTQAGRLPDSVVACVGGGSNAIGIFSAFIPDETVALVGVEPGGEGLAPGQKHGAVLAAGSTGVLHGMKSYVLQTDDGQIQETHSISAGLDYPSVGPEHAYLKAMGRAQYTHATDDEALAAVHILARHEGIIPALESAHALVEAQKLAAQAPGSLILVNLSGRGDKDLQTIMQASP